MQCCQSVGFYPNTSDLLLYLRIVRLMMLISRIFGPILAIQYNAAISTADQFDTCASTYTFGGCGCLFGIRNCKTAYNYYLWIFVY